MKLPIRFVKGKDENDVFLHLVRNQQTSDKFKLK